MRFTLLFASLCLACSGPPSSPDASDGSLVDAGPPFCADEDPGTPRSIFVLPRTGTEPLFDLPYPNDVRLTPEGTVDIATFPNPRRNGFVERYIAAYRERQRGFSTNGAIYFRFSHPVDVSTLPATPEASTATSASVMLIDIDDPASPTFGDRHPLVVHYQECQTLFWSPHTVAMRPVYGLPLAGAHRYAAVVTTRVKQDGGADFARDADFEALAGTGGDAAVDQARTVYGELLTTLETLGVPRSEVLAATVFTTQDPVGELIAIRDWIVSQYPPPAIIGAFSVRSNDNPSFTEISGHYGPSPIFQEGVPPYTDEGGAIELDASGEPTVHGTFDMFFSLMIPKTAMPVNGYPIVLYAHGTGGNARSYVSDEGSWLTPLGFAVMGVDQIFHGERHEAGDPDPGTSFFNFVNPDAGRDNNRQSALDVVQQARIVGEIEITSLRPEPVRFDPSQIYFMGHSQGGLNGPLFLAIDSSARAGMLSAASGVIIPSLVQKVDPPPGIPALVTTALTLPGGNYQEAFALEGFTFEHPIATLIQTWIDSSDPVNYAPMIFQSPRAGFVPKSIFMTEGLMDTFAPPASIEALAGAMGVPQRRPVQQEIAALALQGIAPIDPGATLNVAGGTATAGIMQFPNDGHFAIYDNPAGEMAVVSFFQSLLAGGPGAVP